jgi:hypothetical protein
LGFNPKRQGWWQAHLNETPWTLEREARQIALVSTCRNSS